MISALSRREVKQPMKIAVINYALASSEKKILLLCQYTLRYSLRCSLERDPQLSDKKTKGTHE